MDTYIGSCGHRVWSPEAKLCRTCWLAEKRKNFCVDCGKPVAKGSSQRCLSCFHNSLRKLHVCKGCGNEFTAKEAGPKWERCRDCYYEYRRSQPKPPCYIESCPYPSRVKGLCWNHYRMERTKSLGKTRGQGIGSRSRRAVGDMPCALCGYNKLRSHVHKVVPALGYTTGNMIPLCARCHEETHRGVTPLPDIRF